MSLIFNTTITFVFVEGNSKVIHETSLWCNAPISEVTIRVALRGVPRTSRPIYGQLVDVYILLGNRRPDAKPLFSFLF